MIAIRYEFGTPTYDQAIRLRDDVLRRPLGRSILDDYIEAEVVQTHFGYLDAGRLLGTATLVETADGAWKMRQVAVDPSEHGRGIGRALVRSCEAYAKTRDATRLYCHARLTAREFYVRCGWVAEGDEFTEVDLPHVIMSSPHFGRRG